MNLSLKKLQQKLPQLNKRIHVEADFYRLCRKEKIDVHEIPLRENIYGYYSNYRGKAYIILNSRMNQTKWREVAFHELGHHYLHAPVPNSVFFDSQNLSNRQETEAQSFALLAIIPITLLRQIEDTPSLMEDYPVDIITQRLKLFESLGI